MRACVHVFAYVRERLCWCVRECRCVRGCAIFYLFVVFCLGWSVVCFCVATACVLISVRVLVCLFVLWFCVRFVCGNMYSWIQSYLFQRPARVMLNGQTSSSVKIRGVPQGGVISPTLFIIFIDDICDQLSSHISQALHADDLALWTKAEQVATAAIRMQEAMNIISDWAKEWLAMINRTKTEANCFSLSPKREEFILQNNGQEIHQQDTPTYLGVELNRKLTWSPHISTMHSKALRKLAGTKWGANMKVLT